jgi:hypothetical protein
MPNLAYVVMIRCIVVLRWNIVTHFEIEWDALPSDV